ncbi:nuclear apoptosis-inducing factor 1-like [Eriocheir sinensis]|uniref:nuclear apoptosis-inducing factor 1-like n=1 Tax=Eriocheir sinensis TaxID=95602 RepID=UPI0021C7C845|nr:nuclear apoptosis-inducing factor 1-like [Eriocheir sinensis]
MENIADFTSPKRKRGVNWKDCHTLHIVEQVGLRKTILRGKFSPTLTYNDKRAAWEEVTDSLNSTFGLSRSHAEVEKKWQNTKTTSIQRLSAMREAQRKTGGGSAVDTSLCDITEAVLRVIGEDSSTARGISKGISQNDTALMEADLDDDASSTSKVGRLEPPPTGMEPSPASGDVMVRKFLRSPSPPPVPPPLPSNCPTSREALVICKEAVEVSKKIYEGNSACPETICTSSTSCTSCAQ